MLNSTLQAFKFYKRWVLLFVVGKSERAENSGGRERDKEDETGMERYSQKEVTKGGRFGGKKRSRSNRRNVTETKSS